MSPASPILDRFGRPFASPASGRVGAVRRTGGGHGGTMSGWYPGRHNDLSAASERALLARRSEDLVGNDAHAAGLIEGLTTNVVGTGLFPQSQVDADALGISDEAAGELRDAIEAEFAAWTRVADAGGRMTFAQMQALAQRTTGVQGEHLHLCVSMAGPDGRLPPGRNLAFALQSLSPARLRNPAGRDLDPMIHDGVQLGPYGEAIGYHIAQPDLTGAVSTASIGTSRYYPARYAHRPVVLHGFPQMDSEQVRGRPVMTPALKFFRDLGDCLDHELVGQMMSALFPIVVTSDNSNLAQQLGSRQEDKFLRFRKDDDKPVTTVDVGSVFQLYQGEDIKALESPRPGNNFETFVMRILRAAGASVGMPYEVVVKDFSRTNYSSARAALLEAWRVFRRWQLWLEFGFCTPVWRAVIEEAFARGRIAIPAGAPAFYDAMDAYLAVSWIPPRPGHVDPMKETESEIAALDAGITTYAEVIAARGGDWETVMRQRARERRRMRQLGLEPTEPRPAKPSALPPAEEKDEAVPGQDDQSALAGPDLKPILARLRDAQARYPDDEAEGSSRPSLDAKLDRLRAVCAGGAACEAA